MSDYKTWWTPERIKEIKESLKPQKGQADFVDASDFLGAVSEIERQQSRAEAAEQKLRELQERTRKIPVSERLPENQFAVLGWNAIDEVFIVSYYAETWWTGRNFEYTIHITHWQPLPVPPEAEND